ncbi:MAG: DMP19 family protein [Spirochaetales bacterium]|nr:DMP19 family protein [Spirochaetales bacterium]
MFNVKKVKKILQTKSGQDAIIGIDKLLYPVFLQNPEKLSNPERDIVLIEEWEREVNNGGFNQLFYNTTGNYSLEILEALKKIGSTGFSNIFEKAISVFPEKDVPKDRDARKKLLLKIEEKAERVWEHLDQEFNKHDEDIYRLMVQYINDNIADFR